MGFSGILRGNREYLGNYGVILVSECILKAYFREKYEYFSISIYLICSVVCILNIS